MASKHLKRCSASLTIINIINNQANANQSDETHQDGQLYQPDRQQQGVTARMWRNHNTCVLLEGIYNGATTVEKSGYCLNKLNRIIIRPSNSSPGHISKRTANRHSNKISYTHIHSSTNSQQPKLERIQMSINCLKNKQKCLYDIHIK